MCVECGVHHGSTHRNPSGVAQPEWARGSSGYVAVVDKFGGPGGVGVCVQVQNSNPVCFYFLGSAYPFPDREWQWAEEGA